MNISLSRIEKFRQLKNELIFGEDYIIIGIDVSKKFSVACISTNKKEILLRKFKFNNTIEGANFLMKKVSEIQKQTNIENLVYGLEPTGNYHKPLASYLINSNCDLVGISTVGAKQNRKSLDGRWKKTDPKDAYNIIDMISQGKMFFYKEDLEIENLKSLLKSRQQLSKRLSSYKTRLRNNHFALYFPEIDDLYSNILHREVLQILKYFPTAYDIKNTSFADFNKALESKQPTAKKRHRIYTIWQLAQYSIGKHPNESTYLNIELMLEEVKLIEEQIQKVNKTLLELCKKYKEYELLQTIPGFGPYLSAIFLAHVGNIQNFTHSGQLTKLAGLDLEYAQSGKYNSRAMISKKGNVLLRYALCQAIIVALQNNNINRIYKEKLKIKGESKESKAKLRIKLAEKLLRTAYVMLKNKQAFNMDQFINPVELNLIPRT